VSVGINLLRVDVDDATDNNLEALSLPALLME
jgi:hypothetical protein